MQKRETISLSIIVPVFNEREALPIAIATLRENMTSLGISYEIIVVVSGSTDGSDEISDKLASNFNEVRIIHEPVRNGFGAALRLGFSAAKGDFVTVVPADLPYSLDVIEPSLKMLNGRCDAVIGRRSNDDRIFLRRLQSQIYTLLCVRMLGLDPTSPNAAFKMYKRELVQSLPLRSNGWFLDTEIVYHLRQNKVKTQAISIDLMERTTGTSTVTLLDAIRVFKQLVEFGWRVRNERKRIK